MASRAPGSPGETLVCRVTAESLPTGCCCGSALVPLHTLLSACRTVRIRDRRLGMPYYAFLVGILAYNVFIIFVEVGLSLLSMYLVLAGRATTWCVVRLGLPFSPPEEVPEAGIRGWCHAPPGNTLRFCNIACRPCDKCMP
jgi:hypothetical protein